MAGQDGAGEVGLALAQRVEDGAMVVIGAGFPIALPGGEQKAGAGGLQGLHLLHPVPKRDLVIKLASSALFSCA